MKFIGEKISSKTMEGRLENYFFFYLTLTDIIDFENKG
jgi:hypothetical protein